MGRDDAPVSIQDLALPRLVVQRRASLLLQLNEVHCERDVVHCGRGPAIPDAAQVHDPGCDFDYSPLPPLGVQEEIRMVP